jgi:hypothetical protein
MPKISGLSLGQIQKISGMSLGQIKKVSGLGLGLLYQYGFTDDFNRANGSIGSNWTVNATPPVIASNAAQCAAAASGSPVSWGICNAFTFASPTRQHVEIVVANPASDGSTTYGSILILNNTGTPASGVCAALLFYNATQGMAMYTVSGSTFTQRALWNSPTFNAGGIVTFEQISGVYSGYYNGSLLGSWTDSTNIVPRDSSHLYGGFILQGNKPAGAQVYSKNLDSFTMYDP